MIFLCFAAGFLLSALCGKFVIPALVKLKFGQSIKEIGPKWHLSKNGTPTMGGIIFIVAMIVSIVCGVFAFGISKDKAALKSVAVLVVTALGFGMIGFLDDYIKVILKRNLGLRAAQKFSLQFLVALVVAVWIVSEGVVDTKIAIPFTGFGIKLHYMIYIPLIILVMLAAVNSVNLTDGLDGLAACITLVIGIFYCIISNITENLPLVIFSSALIGGLIGFLIYNKFPAKVFMGDTGSLFLGGAVAIMAIYLKNPLLLLIVGLVYVIEALSVILQVAWFKKTGKRIFKMSPIHHHFEMCGWSEVKIVAVFSAVTLLFCLIGFVTLI